jgi:hypothetical protein
METAPEASAGAEAAEPMEEPAEPEALAPPEREPAAPAPTPEPSAAEDNARAEPTVGPSEKSGVQEVPTGEGFAQQTAPDEVEQAQPASPLFSTLVQIVLAAVAVLSGLIALILRYIAIHKWRAKAK